jgi:hypothetical protein
MLEATAITAIVGIGCGTIIVWGSLQVIEKLREISTQRQCNRYEDRMFRNELKVSFKDLEKLYYQIEEQKKRGEYYV